MQVSRKLFIALTAAPLALASASVSAQPAPGFGPGGFGGDSAVIRQAERLFGEIDKDGAGRITREQARAAAAARFAELDKDGDGEISRADRQAWMAEAPARRFAALDKDADGKVLQTVTNDTEGNVSFNVEYNKAGEYRYTISEVGPGGAENNVKDHIA